MTGYSLPALSLAREAVRRGLAFPLKGRGSKSKPIWAPLPSRPPMRSRACWRFFKSANPYFAIADAYAVRSNPRLFPGRQARGKFSSTITLLLSGKNDWSIAGRLMWFSR